METKVTQYKHCDLIKVSGRVDSLTAPKLGEGLNKIADGGQYKIVIDMSEVQFLSSAGLRVLISCQKTSKRYNRGEVMLAAVPANILAVFELAGFTSIFKIFPDVIAAVGSF
jgi:anti-sigma B factor antagonist